MGIDPLDRQADLSPGIAEHETAGRVAYKAEENVPCGEQLEIS